MTPSHTLRAAVTVQALRDYQVRTVAETRAAIRSGKRRVLIVSPTGSGKTTIAGEIIRSASGHPKKFCSGP
jgi:superfamily II DNA or RNA helicase